MAQIRNLFFLFAITVFAIASTILTIYNYNPFAADKSVFISFYGSFLAAVAGILSMAIYYFRMKFVKNQSSHPFWPSIREGILISTAFTAMLVLQGLKILDWLIAGSMIVVVVLLELFFQTKKNKAVIN